MISLANGKIFNQKIFIILSRHLWVVELTYRYFFYSNFTSGVSSLILIPFIATGVVDTGGKFAAGIIDTGGKPAVLVGNFTAAVVDTSGKLATGVVDTGGASTTIAVPV